MDKEKRQDIIVKVCCVIAALGLWMYVRVNENPVITSTVKYVPVQILNEDSLAAKSLILMPNQEFYVNVTVKGTTSAVSDIDKNKDFKLIADLSGYALSAGENKVQVTVKQSPAGISVVNSDSLILKMDIDNLLQKDFKITANVEGTLPEGYYNDENTVSQDMATVEGPERYVKEVDKVVADVDINNAESDISQNYKLKAVDIAGKEVGGINIYPEYTQVVSKIKIGKHVPVKAVTTGSTDSSVIIESITPSVTTVELIGDKEVIDAIDTINTKPINISSINGDTTISVDLDLPEGVRTAGDSSTVEVVITAKRSIEKTVKIPITFSGLGTGLKESHGISEVQLSLKGEESSIDALNTQNIKATVDLSGLSAGKQTVAINIAGVPSDIQIVSRSAETVDVDITAENEETFNNDN